MFASGVKNSWAGNPWFKGMALHALLGAGLLSCAGSCQQTPLPPAEPTPQPSRGSAPTLEQARRIAALRAKIPHSINFVHPVPDDALAFIARGMKEQAAWVESRIATIERIERP